MKHHIQDGIRHTGFRWKRKSQVKVDLLQKEVRMQSVYAPKTNPTLDRNLSCFEGNPSECLLSKTMRPHKFVNIKIAKHHYLFHKNIKNDQKEKS